MKKFLPYIERYVHWVALGLGAVFVLYMVYAYVLTPPVTAELNGKTVDLGNVDRVTREGPVVELERAIQTGVPADTLDKIQVQAPLPKFQQAVTKVEAPPVFAGAIPAMNLAPPIQYPPGTVPPPTAVANNNAAPDADPNNLNSQPPQVAEFAPPASLYVAVSAGRSAVVPPPQPVNPNPGVPADPNAPAPIQPVQPIQPIQPIQPVANAAPGAPGAPNVPTIDKNWVSLHYRIPGGALADAFKRAGVPAVRSATSFLRVELIRQEQLPNGQWGNDTVVPPLSGAFLDAPAWPLPANPNAALQQAAEAAYITWAQSHAQAILQPAFYQVVKGDLPGLPGEPVLAIGMPNEANKPFDPLNPGPGPYTEEQKAQIKAARLEEARRKAEEAKQRRLQPRTPGARPNQRNRGGEPGMGGDVAFSARDSQRPGALHQVRYPRPPVMEDIAPPEDMMGMEPGMGGTTYVQQGQNEALNRLLQTIPTVSPFDPAQLVADIDVIAYDENPEPGKTYRYQMRYYVLNPIMGAINLVKNPAFAQQFALASQPSAWSEQVYIQTSVDFFLAGGAVGGDTAKLDIYRWQNGDVNRVNQNVSPGDRIGLTTKDGIDYSTKWTVVDVRGGVADRYVLLQSDDGQLARRDFRTDTQSPTKKSLDAQFNAAQEALKAAAAAANPAGVANPTPTLTR